MSLSTRVASLEVEDLVGEDFRQAVNGLAFFWRQRPDLRAELASRLWEILPAPEQWPKDEGEVAVVRLVLTIARSETVDLVAAQRLLAAVTSFLDRQVCAEIHTLPFFLLLWNIAALHYERGGDGTFENALPGALMDLALELLRERVRPRGHNREKLAQLALAGLLAFLDPRLHGALRRILAPLRKSEPWLYPEALELTFVPALFALEGIALLRSARAVFTPMVCLGLLTKSQEYDDVGPTVESLRERVQGYGRLG